MSAGGGGDRPGMVPAFVSGDRPPAIRAVQATLFDFADDPIALVTMVLAGDTPEVVMFAGEPFLLRCDGSVPGLAYVQTRPYRADCSMVKELRP